MFKSLTALAVSWGVSMGATLLLALMPIGAQAQWTWLLKGPRDFAEVYQVIGERYPGVDQITTEQLASWLRQPEPPLLLDNRTLPEFETSHLAGAIWVKDVKAARAEIARARALSPNRKIVFYCSVGYRSTALIADLQKQPDRGFVDGVYNLKGSIFMWANEGRPMMRREGKDEVPFDRVHPYDAKYVPLLLPARRAVP